MSQLPIDYSNLSEKDPIEELHLTNRSFNALTRAGIGTVEEISRLVDSGRLRTISGLGKKSASEIEAKVAKVKNLDGAGVEPKIDSVPDEDHACLSPDAPITKLNLSERSLNALRRISILTVGEVRELSESGRLGAIRGLGTKCTLEIRDSLDQAKIHDVPEVEAPAHIAPNRNAASFSREDPIENLDLSVRSYNALTRAGVQTVGELLQLVDTGKLSAISALGRKSISEIKGELAQLKISEGVRIGAHTDKTINQNYFLLSRNDAIEALNLTAHSFSALVRADVRTIENLLEFVEFGNLQSLRELGINCILEIANILPRIKFSDSPEAASWAPSDVWRLLVAKILRDSEVEIIAGREEIPKRVVEWQLQLVSKQLSRGLLHEDAEIAGKSIGEWIKAVETTESNQAYQVLSTILSGSMNICEEIEHFLGYLPGQSTMTILLFRYGLKFKTLEQTGVEIGITRERARQLEKNIKNKTISISNLKNRPILLRMQSALLIARDLGLNITYENWTQRIRSSGLVGDWTSLHFADTDAIEATIAISKLATECKIPWLRIPENLQYVVQLAVSGTPSIPARIQYARENLPAKVKRLIDRHARFSGGVYAKWLSQELGMELERLTDILQVLEYVSLSEGWYIPKLQRSSFEITRDDVFHRCMHKMLQYCAQLNIEDICAGIRHGISRSGYSEPEYLATQKVAQPRSMFPVPPPDVMVEILKIYGYQCKDGLYYWDGEIDQKLSAGESVIMNCLEVVGPVLHHSELVLALTESDLSLPTLHATLNSSPLFDKINSGLYKLRGKEVTSQDIERAKSAAEPQSLQPAIEYHASGNITVSFTLSAIALAAGTVFCDEFPNLSGNWPCHVNGQKAGELTATENEFRHLRKSFELLNCKPGDRLALIFNMWNRTVEIELTGENAQV